MSYPVLYSKTERKNIPAIAGIAIAGASIVGDTSRNEAPFATQGLGTLSDCMSCTVTEDRNGAYELTMQYPISGVHFTDLEQRAFILAKPNYTDDPQPFRIYAISKPLNGICTINAQHISYDLSGKEIPMGVTAANLTAAVSQLSAYSAPFKIKTTKTGTAPFKTDVPSSVRSWLGGKEGSLLDLYGGEWHWDGYTCTLSTSRGANRGVTIRYGKNLTSLKQDEECSNVYSGVRAYYTTSEGVTISGGLVRTGITLDTTRTFFLDASGYFGSNVPSVAQLNAYASQYITQNGLNAPKVNLTLNFVQLQGLAERVDLCDTVTIQFEALGVSATAKCIQTTWDVLRERYTSTTFGDARSNLNSTLNGIQTKITSDMSVAIRKSAAATKSDLEKAIDNATSKITGNAGGYVVLHDTDSNGEPDEILIMDTDDISTATKVWRWNKSGLGYSDTGYDGSYGLAITADGQIVADFITTGTLDASSVSVVNLDASNINTGTLSAARIAANSIAVSKLTGSITNGNWEINLTNGTMSIGNLSASNITAGTITGAVTATNFTMTGGSINITTDSETNDRILLNSDKAYSRLSPNGLVITNTALADNPNLRTVFNGGAWTMLHNDSQKIIAWIGGTNGYGALHLNNASGTDTFYATGGNSNAALGMTDSNAVLQVNLLTGANGGILYLKTASGTNSVYIGGGGAYGGFIQLYDSSHILKTSVGVTDTGGRISLGTGSLETIVAHGGESKLTIRDANKSIAITPDCNVCELSYTVVSTF